MSDFLTLPEIDEVANSIRSRTNYRPRIAMVLGSGLGGLASSVENAAVIPYNELPGWPVSTVVGHQGRLVIGQLEGQEVMMMQGRAHYYEGYSMDKVTLPMRVFQRMGMEIVIVTNAAGAVNPDFQPGELMLITDHLNLIGMAGPSFETPADLRFLRMIGVDAVGMSTVPEVIVARHGGTRVLGISGISNKANLDGNTLTTHQEVLEAGQRIVPKLTAVVRGALKKL